MGTVPWEEAAGRRGVRGRGAVRPKAARGHPDPGGAASPRLLATQRYRGPAHLASGEAFPFPSWTRLSVGARGRGDRSRSRAGAAWDRRGEGRLRPGASPEARPPQGSAAPATARGYPSTAPAPLGDRDGLLPGSWLRVEKSAEVRTSPTLGRAAASPGAWDTGPQPPPGPSGPACVSAR